MTDFVTQRPSIGGPRTTRRVPSKDVLLTKQLLAEEPKPKGRCSFCGAPARGGDVCHAHSDLVKGVKA